MYPVALISPGTLLGTTEVWGLDSTSLGTWVGKSLTPMSWKGDRDQMDGVRLLRTHVLLKVSRTLEPDMFPSL